eukprot:scaffold218968_cov34-Tisochrysis_lutea.AAC.3
MRPGQGLARDFVLVRHASACEDGAVNPARLKSPSSLRWNIFSALRALCRCAFCVVNPMRMRMMRSRCLSLM